MEQFSYIGRAESVTVEEDEHGFELHITTEHQGLFVVNIHGVLSEYLKGTEKIVDYITEGAYSAAFSPPHDNTLHSVHADIWDAREGK